MDPSIAIFALFAVLVTCALILSWCLILSTHVDYFCTCNEPEDLNNNRQ